MSNKTSQANHLSKIKSLLLSKSISSWMVRNLKLKFGFPRNKEPVLYPYSRERFISEISNFSFALLIIASVISFFLSYHILENKSVQTWELLTGVILSASVHDILKGTIESHTGSLIKAIEIENNIDTSNYSRNNNLENESRQRYFLSCLVTDKPMFPIGDLKFVDIEQPITDEIDRIGSNVFSKSLSRKFEDEKKLRKARCIIMNLPDKDFFQPISLKASMHALGKSEKSEMKKGNLEYIFFRDIHAYMKAWVVCSIECSHNSLMPISVIGLNYPTSDNPNKGAYKIAIQYIIDDLLESPNSHDFLTFPKAKQELKRSLGLLIREIERY